MSTWWKPMDHRSSTSTITVAYREGYNAYLSWECNGGERPENPYWTGDLEGEPREHTEWQAGWDAAAWDN